MEGRDSQSTPNDEESIARTSSSVPNHRQKRDLTWKYVSEVNSGGRKILRCDFCSKEFSGGGINRLKCHLAGVKGNVAACIKVPSDVRILTKVSLEENVVKAKEKKGSCENPFSINGDQLSCDDLEEISTPPTQNKGVDKNAEINKGKRKLGDGIEAYMTGKAFDSSQPSLKSCMQSKERCHGTDMALALWFYDACIPFNAVNSIYFSQAMAKIASMGHGYNPPSYHLLRVNLLRDAKKQVEMIIDNFRSNWEASGCTIMGDGWKDNRQRSLINFLVYCPTGIAFIKSVDASAIVSNAENLCNLFSEIIEIVGPANVVHLVTDNASNYKAAGRLVSDKYPNICWSPCAAHCLNLIMKDIGEMPKIADLVILASRVTVFVYNRKWILSWLRQRPGWREILRPAETIFGTTFIALQSLLEHREHLEALVTCAEFKNELKGTKGKEVKLIVLNDSFWNNCLVIVKIMGPLIRLLRICDSDEKPSLGYVYDGMWRVINGIKNLFKNKEHMYAPYVDILEKRWDAMLKKDLHAAAFWLNPAFQYEPNTRCSAHEVWKCVIEVMERMDIEGLQDVMDEITLFRTRSKSFGYQFAKNTCNTSRPDEWWRNFGGDAPHLQKLAIRLLSQTASSSGCERNWSVFERIHAKKRNRLEHQRLNDLVYVHYNLRLKNRAKNKDRYFDPIDYESIDKTDFWILEEEPEPELDFVELEEMMQRQTSNNGEGGSSSPRTNRSTMLDEDDDIVELPTFIDTPSCINANTIDDDVGDDDSFRTLVDKEYY